MSKKYDLSNSDDMAEFHFELARLKIRKPIIELKEVTQGRTPKQNNALHVFFGLLADAFNEAGLDMRKVLKETVDIPWSADNVKTHIWKPIQKAQLGKESTTELSTKDIDKVYETLNRYLGDRFGMSVEFPNQENKRG